MAVLLATVVDGLGIFVWMIWGMQRQLSSNFVAVSSAASPLAAALVLCIVSFHWHRPRDLGLPFI